MDFIVQSEQLQHLLGLRWPPIAITFRESAPSGISRVEAAAPSGCTYWKLAAEGKVFYTESADHYGCPIGAYTHGVNLPSAQAQELEGMIETMVSLSYLKKVEIPAIPRRATPFSVAVYAPLAYTPLPPDVVMVRGNAKQMMLLAEAANAAHAGSTGLLMGRPTCAAIPAVLKTQPHAMSLACIGNRVYNELSDNDLYCAVAGPGLADVVNNLAPICTANSELEKFHTARTVGHSN